MPELPTGTVTFLFTDIEGSTRLWEQHPEAMQVALARHDALLRTTIEAHGGQVFKTVGDAFYAVFTSAPEAVAAALDAQRALSGLLIDDCRLMIEGTVLSPNQQSAISNQQFLKVRMALHSGVADRRGGDYFGAPLNRVARLLSAAHGGQVLLSQAIGQRAREILPTGAFLRDLGAHRLKDLQQPEQIAQLLHPDLPGDFPPLRSLEAFAHNLPRQLTSFIGREREIAEVKQLLAATCLLTLTGSGGCGKTRLALQVAADLVEEHSDGVWLVELAALVDPALVPQAVAAALGVREEPGRPLIETLTDYLRPRSLLLVLDNCEHLLAVSAETAEALLRACPGLRLLASSREGLGIAGETTYRVPSLSLPDLQSLPPLDALTQFEAVRLFVERASAAMPSFALNDRNAPTVASVCQRLDGIPLAIELAASRVKALSVEKLNERLDDMFRLLTGGSRTALPRQQTLRALIDWSYELLSEAERALLRRLSVFAGGWTLEAAEAVCGEVMSDECRVMSEEATPSPTHHSSLITHHSDILELLTSLVEKSLVLHEEREGEGRYRLLETVRQYARDRLLESGEAEAVREHHLGWFLGFVERAEQELRRRDQATWLDRLEWEHGNLRAALAWCQSAEMHVESGLRLSVALGGFWKQRGYASEGREWVQGTLARADAGQRTALRARALHEAADLAWMQADYTAARSMAEESVAIYREIEDQQGLSWALGVLGMVTYQHGDTAAAYRLLEEAAAIVRAREDIGQQVILLNQLGEMARSEGDYTRAAAFYAESVALGRKQENAPLLVLPLLNLALVTEYQGDYQQSASLLRESVALCQEQGNRWGLVLCLPGWAGVANGTGQPEQAARLLGAAEALRTAIGIGIDPADRPHYERYVAGARAALGEEAFAAAWSEGRATSLDDAVALALQQSDAEKQGSEDDSAKS